MAEGTLETITRMADQLSRQEQQSLVQHLAQKLWQTHEAAAPNGEELSTPQDLYGIWRHYFPDDPDIDEILHEIRHAWEEEWSELSEP